MKQEVVSIDIASAGEVVILSAEYEEVDATAIRGRLDFTEGGRTEFLLHGEGEKRLWINDHRDCYSLTVDPQGDTFIARRIELPQFRRKP